MYTLQILPGHMVNSRPQEWSDTGPAAGEIDTLRAYWLAIRSNGASGDQYRIVDESGTEQAIISSTQLGPLY